MIYIWDNGLDYSDHTIEFVESGLPRDVVETILSVFAAQRRKACVLAVAERIEWRTGGNVALSDWCKMHLDSWCAHANDCASQHLYDANMCSCSSRNAVDLAFMYGLLDEGRR